jgi:hypothetical protein
MCAGITTIRGESYVMDIAEGDNFLHLTDQTSSLSTWLLFSMVMKL